MDNGRKTVSNFFNSLVSKQAQAANQLPEHLREFDDVDKTRDLIYNNVLTSLTTKFPYSDGKHRLELHDVKYSGPQEYTWEEQKKALMNNRSLKTPIKGKWKLFDEETGELLDEKEEVVMDVPYFTQRGTIINNGSEYTIVNQSRLKPGMYTRTKQNGEHEAQFNVKPGTGRGFRVWMEPSTGVFMVNVGQANVPAYPFLKAQGVTDEQMKESWGPEVYQSNIDKADSQAIHKLYTRFAGNKANNELSEQEKTDYLRQAMLKAELDERVVERTAGLQKTKNVTPELLLRTTNKLLNINRKQEAPDDRDAPEFSNILSVEDFVKERIEKDAGNTARTMLFNLRRDRNLSRVRRGALNSYMSSLLLGSGLAAPIEETNPFQLMDQQNRIIKLGEGGIGSAETITDEARDVNNGQMGFIDPVAGPESDKVGIDVRASFKSFKGNDQQIYAEFLDTKGNKKYLKPEDMTGKVLAFPGQDPTKKPEATAIKDGKMVQVPWEEVDYTVPSQAHMYFGGFNLTPLPTSFQPGRAFYASKYWSQYLPLTKGEVPLVQSKVPGEEKSFAEYYGRKTGTISSKVGGVVTKVTDAGVTVTDEEGKKHFYETVKDFPFNRITAVSFSPKVKPGDVVKPGDMIAHSNFTDKDTGAFNMGVNLKTAVVPYEGFSYEDAYVISQSAAKKLETERLVGFDKANKGDNIVNKNKFMSSFSDKFSKEQYDNIGDNGVAKPGTILKQGDPIILAIGPKVLGKEDEKLGKLHKALRNAFKDESVVWESKFPGVVTDIGVTSSGVKVNVKSSSPTQPGDKLANLAASKGVVGKIVKDEEMPIDQATGEPYEMLLNPMVVLSRVAPNQLAEMQLAKIAKKTGKPYILPSEPPEEGWSSFAKAELDKNGMTVKNTIYDPVQGREIKNLGEGYMYISAFHHLAEKKLSGRDMVGGYTSNAQPAKGGKTGAKRFCFPALQKVWTSHGEITIGHIVEKNIPILVYAPDKTGVWGLHRVTNWFSRKGSASEVLNVTVSNVRTESDYSRVTRTFYPTVNHEVYLYTGEKVKACELKVGDKLITQNYQVTNDQFQILLGSMLGDGAICHGATTFFSEMHSIKQKEYLDWKGNCLSLLTTYGGVKTSIKPEVTTGLVNTTETKRVCSLVITREDIVEQLTDLFIEGKKKVIKPQLLPLLGDLALAVWFLDDGCVTSKGKRKDGSYKRTGTIATMGFTEEENEALASFLTTYTGCEVHRKPSDNSLSLSAKACDWFVNIVCKYIPYWAIPRSKGHLREVARVNRDAEVKIDVASQLGNIPCYVREISPYKDSKGATEINLYDIEVADVHRYCASNIVVSNSLMDINALLSHGATEVIKDAHLIRGTKNEDYWNTLRAGRPLPEPETPFIYDKFMNTLKAGGINVRKEGDILTIMPMTNADIDKLSAGEIKNSRTVDIKNQDSAPGGLFDMAVTGGTNGCFHPSVQIWTDKGMMAIGDIVKNKRKVNVWTYNFSTKCFELKPVTNWFTNVAPNGIGKASFKTKEGRITGACARFGATTLWGTKEHQVYKLDGTKVDLSKTNELLAAEERLNDVQSQVFLGSMLGDGYLYDGTYRETHSLKQKEYLMLKKDIFGNLMSSYKEFTDTSGGAVRRKCLVTSKKHKIFYDARRAWYVGSTKVVNKVEVETLTDLGLAVWFFDDGYYGVDNKNVEFVKLCTNSFSYDDVTYLQDLLFRKFDLKSSIVKAGKYKDKPYGWEINLYGVQATLLINKVTPYAVNCMTYKVIPQTVTTKVCHDCGGVMATRMTKRCKVCAHKYILSFGSKKLPKECRGMYPELTSSEIRQKAVEVVSLNAQDVNNNVERKEERKKVAGSKVGELLTNTQLVKGIAPIACEYNIGTTHRYEGTKTVYDIEVKDNHNYFANGILVSNSKWGHVTLAEPLPNPVMEEPIRRVLGLTVKQFHDVLTGREQLNGETGGKALRRALGAIDVDKEIVRYTNEVKTTRGARRDNAIKALRYLNAAKKQSISPTDWVIDKVPVIPPAFRPISNVGDMLKAADLNGLYRDVIETNNSIKELRNDIPDSELADEKLNLYKSVTAAFGLGDPITPDGVSKRWKGAIRQVIGTNPKCYDDATEILTENGWLPFPAYVDSRLQVATLNPVTDTLEFQNPTSILHEHYSGDMVHTHTRRLDLMVTAGHWHYVELKDDTVKVTKWLPPQKVQAMDLANGIATQSRYVIGAANFTGCEFPYVFDGIAVSQDTLAEFAGWYLRRGRVTKDNTVGLARDYNASDVNLMDKAVQTLGLPYKKVKHSVTPTRSIIRWEITSPEFGIWVIGNFGVPSRELAIPKDVPFWHKEHQVHLLAAYFGDPARLPSKVVWTTTSKGLVEGIALMCTRIGYVFQSSVIIPEVQWRCTIHKAIKETVSYNFQTTVVSNWQGMVHCVTVPNGLIFVRRNGKVSVSGNTGMFQSNVLSKTVDSVGRGVVVPNPNLDMDTVGIPEAKAWTIYRPFIIREMVRRGIPQVKATELIDNKDKEAKEVMLDVMDTRPVILDRAPTWHKFNLLAFKPVLTDTDTIQVSPLITSGFNMDFDGDTANFHVPVSDKAVQQAWDKMTPSKNLFALNDLKTPQHTPSKEMVMGLYQLTRKPANKKPIVFTSVEEAKKAYKEGLINANDPIEIRGK